jgi:hypothetical protein
MIKKVTLLDDQHEAPCFIPGERELTGMQIRQIFSSSVVLFVRYILTFDITSSSIYFEVAVGSSLEKFKKWCIKTVY